MKLAEATWPEVREWDRAGVVLVPTGSLEQHGPHLPLLTDTILVTAVSEAVEARSAASILLTPTLWLGASTHHLGFDGSLSASFESYASSLEAVIESAMHHGATKVFVVNGHGGNTELNGIACRRIKDRFPTLLLGHAGYFSFIGQAVLDEVMDSRTKAIRHACEAETSLMLHVRPDLVRFDRVVDDGLVCEPDLAGMVWPFSELTVHGVLGQATLATPEKGQRLFDAAVDGLSAQLKGLAEGPMLVAQDWST